jgi:hypothetical protein
MNDINKPSSPDNLGGLERFWYIPVDDITSIGPVINGKVSITLSSGKKWYEFYASQGSINFKEAKKIDGKGETFTLKLSGFTPRDSEDLFESFMLMSKQKFACVYLDNNGNHKIVGSPREPLRFSYEFSPGKNPSNRNGYDFSFSRQTKSRSLFVSNFS